MEKRLGQQSHAESKTRLLEQINGSLHSGDYSRALDLLRGAASEFPNDAELSQLDKLAQDGVKHKAEADRLITESQELFAQQKSAQAIQLLRKAYELDKSNSLARAILANALVEHAHSMVEADWLEAETLTNQALALNPAHPTARTILNVIVHKKETSSVEDWVTQARKLHSSGDLFAALAWVAEGLAIHPHDPKLLQVQDAIQRDQDARRRQARRSDLDELRRLQQEINGAADIAAKQALAFRIQTVAAKHWTDGEILSIANALLLRLGLVPQESSSTSPRSKGATLILHVPRPTAPKAPPTDTSQGTPEQSQATKAQTTQTPPTQLQSTQVQSSRTPPSPALPNQTSPSQESSAEIPAAVASPCEASESKFPTSKIPLRTPVGGKSEPPSPSAPLSAPTAAPVLAGGPFPPAVKGPSPSSRPKLPAKSNPTGPVLFLSAAAVILVAAIFFFTRNHRASSDEKAPAVAPTVSTTAVPDPPVSAPTDSAPAQSPPGTFQPALAVPSDAEGKVTPDDQPTAESAQKVGTLLVVAGQDDASVFLNGRLQQQLTQNGQLRLPNLKIREYVVRVSKNGFQDPPLQKIHIRSDEEARLIFNLRPQPPHLDLAALAILSGTPGTTVLVDHTSIGTIPPDGMFSVSTISPGDHTVELRKERFKPRQFNKHFVAGRTISLAAADAALEAAAGELKITFAPPDANVALVKGDLLKMVSSGVPLDLTPGTYTLTARTADRFTRSSTVEVVAGQSKSLTLSLVPNGMSKWDDPAGWKREGDSFMRKGGDFVLYGVAPASGTFVFSAMPAKGHLLQWVFNYSDANNYVLFQMDDNNFYRTVIRNGNKTDQIIVPHKGDKKSSRTLHIRVSPTEIVHQIKDGNSWTVLDRWTQPGSRLGLGKFGFYIPGNDQVAISSFSHYADLDTR